MQEDQARGRTTPHYSAEQHPQGPPQAHPQGRPLYAPPAKTSNVHRKVLAGAAGGGVGSNLAVILAWHFPNMPATVTAAYSALIILVLTFLTSYLTKPEEN